MPCDLCQWNPLKPPWNSVYFKKTQQPNTTVALLAFSGNTFTKTLYTAKLKHTCIELFGGWSNHQRREEENIFQLPELQLFLMELVTKAATTDKEHNRTSKYTCQNFSCWDCSENLSAGMTHVSIAAETTAPLLHQGFRCVPTHTLLHCTLDLSSS